MGCSRTILLSVNALMLFLSLVVAGTAIYGLTDSSFIVSAIPEVVPSYTFTVGIIFAGAVFVLSLLGLCSAKYRNKCGLMVYFFIVLVALVAQGCVSGYLLTREGVISDAKAQNLAQEVSREVRRFEDDLIGFATSHSADWAQTQDSLTCCGYDIRASRGGNSVAGALVDTGAVCSAHAATLAAIVNDVTTYPTLKDAQAAVDAQLGVDFYCKSSVLDFAQEYATTLGIAAGSLALVQLICLVAACSLALCTSRHDGGFGEDFDHYTGFRARNGQQQQEHDAGALAGTRTSEGAPIATANAAYTYA